MATPPIDNRPRMLSRSTFERTLAAIEYVEGLVRTRAPLPSRQRFPGSNWHAWGLLAAGDTISARSGLRLGEGDVELCRQDPDDPKTLVPTGEVIHIYNPGDAITAAAYDDTVLELSWRSGYWSVRKRGASATTSSRCACPEPPYLVDVACAHCSACYDEVPARMPRLWWLEITSAEASAYGYYDGCAIACADLAGSRILLTNETDAYDAPTCVWSGQGQSCLCAELDVITDAYGDPEWRVTITDRDGCVLAVAYAPVALFDCCGTTSAWTIDAASVCNVTISVRPHECVCCPPALINCGCPDPGMAASLVFTISGIQTDPEGHTPCPCEHLEGSYTVLHDAPDDQSCNYHGGKDAGQNDIGNASLVRGNDCYWHLYVDDAACAYLEYRCHVDDYDCCLGGTFERVTLDKREDPAAHCYRLPDSIDVAGAGPCTHCE